MMKPVRKCSNCGQRTMRLVQDRYVTEVKHDGHPYRIDLPDLPYYKCAECESVVLPDEANAAIGRQLRIVAGLLLPEEIRRGRTALGLRQKELADILGIAEATVCRWETGAQIQQTGYDRALRAFFNVPEMRSYYLSLRTCTP